MQTLNWSLSEARGLHCHVANTFLGSKPPYLNSYGFFKTFSVTFTPVLISSDKRWKFPSTQLATSTVFFLIADGIEMVWVIGAIVSLRVSQTFYCCFSNRVVFSTLLTTLVLSSGKSTCRRSPNDFDKNLLGHPWSVRFPTKILFLCTVRWIFSTSKAWQDDDLIPLRSKAQNTTEL